MLRTSRIRLAAGLAIAATGAASFLAFAPSANAADKGAVTGLDADPAVATAVYAGTNNQPATSWKLTVPAMAIGDTVTITVDDNDAAANCAATDDTVGFAGTPTITNKTDGSTLVLTAALSKTAGACTVSGINDVLTLTATKSSSADSSVVLSNITYNVGKAAAIGPVQYKVAPGAFTTTLSNAIVSNVKVASTNPLTLVDDTKQDQPIPNVVFQEQNFGAVPAVACLRITTPNVTFQATPKPTVTATGGDGKGVPGTVTVAGTDVSFTVDKSTKASGVTTYTLAGLQLDTNGASGPITASAGSACGTADFNTSVRLASVGGVDRIQGADRYATAAKIADQEFGDLSDTTVVIARGDAFPDALAASYLAGQNESPILLTQTNSIPSDTVAALKAHGVHDVVIVGGTSAISSAVEKTLDDTKTYPYNSNTSDGKTLTVTRVGGNDRYQTAKLVAESPGLNLESTADEGLTGTTCKPVKTAIVATGENFPDALAAGGLAYGGMDGCGSGPIPLLLTQSAGLNPATVAALTNLDIEQVILMGGTSAINAASATALTNLNLTVVRVDGANRQETAANLATKVLGDSHFGDWSSDAFLVSRGDNFPDALAASSISGSELSPLFLSESTSKLGTVAAKGIIDYPGDFSQGTLLGGTDALTSAVATEVAGAIAAQ